MSQNGVENRCISQCPIVWWSNEVYNESTGSDASVSGWNITVTKHDDNGIGASSFDATNDATASDAHAATSSNDSKWVIDGIIEIKNSNFKLKVCVSSFF